MSVVGSVRFAIMRGGYRMRPILRPGRLWMTGYQRGATAPCVQCGALTAAWWGVLADPIPECMHHERTRRLVRQEPNRHDRRRVARRKESA